MRYFSLALVLIVALWGCQSSTAVLDANSGTDFAAFDGISGPDVLISPDGTKPLPDAPTVDYGPGTDAKKQDAGSGNLGDPCQGNSDCDAGYCVPSDIGYICTTLCMDDCPEGWDCKAIAYTDPDTIFVCLPQLDQVCQVNGVCEAGEEFEEPCGNCGTRNRTCKDNCQWGEWSNCYGEGQCVAGTQEDKSCGACAGTQVRVCSEQCVWQPWSECAGLPGNCTLPGEIETQTCGNCGESFRTCTEECTWTDWSPCQGTGDCTPGDSDSKECGLCGNSLRMCKDDCSWSQWGECTQEGVCAVGETLTQDCGKCGSQTRTCTSECQWSAWGSCEGEGGCLSGEVDFGDCGNCGKKQRTCNDDCVWEAWSQCQDEGQCSPNQKVTENCGKCGTRERVCTGECTWSQWGACTGEGPCSPDAMETQACGNCGEKPRFCAQDCNWGPWGNCMGEGNCAPGQTTACNNCGTQTCNSSCGWGTCNYGNTDGYEENDYKSAAYTLPGITDAAGNIQTVSANINPAYDKDWYKIDISDTTWHAIDPKITLSGVPSAQLYKICVTYECKESDKVFNACDTTSNNTAVTLDVGSCEGILQGDDDSGTAYIQITPLTTGSCSSYTLQVEA